jgi:hypothetical protein
MMAITDVVSSRHGMMDIHPGPQVRLTSSRWRVARTVDDVVAAAEAQKGISSG